MKRWQRRERARYGIDATSRVLARLDHVRDRGHGRFVACCPAHDDADPSLSIKVLDDGRILVHCFAGCGVEQILAAIGLQWSDLYAGRAPRMTSTHVQWNARDLLWMARREIQVVIVALSDLLAGKAMSTTDQARVVVAHDRLTKLLEVTRD